MLVVGVSFSVRRKFSGRNGKNPTQALRLAVIYRALKRGLVHPVRRSVFDDGGSTFPSTTTCISPLIYEVFWHYLRLIFFIPSRPKS
jgi:hypothetical protein